MNNKYERLLHEDSRENDFWPSFTDLLSTILLVVLLVFMAVMINKQSEVAKSAELIKAKEQEIGEQKEVIQQLVGVKKDIIQDLIQNFNQTELTIEIDESTGAIKFQDDLLFETGKSDIRPEFKNQLKKFIPAYFDTLFGSYGDHIAEVVVEGHTDDVGNFNSNLVLSQERAFSVVQYMLSDEFGGFPYKDKVKDRITANGRSESLLKYKKDSKEVDRQKSRRVEFKFRLKNDTEWESILKEIDNK
jgi:chemotaxis protein MotB